MREYVLSVLPGQASMRLDLLIAAYSKEHGLGFSRTFIQKLMREGGVRIKNEILRKPHYKVKTGEEFIVRVEKKAALALAPENIPLEVIYEDEDIAVVNKPVGLVVHPAPGNFEHTLANALLYHFKSLSDINPSRPGIVHRLDKETSGLLVVAKNNAAHLALARQFADHTIKRKYIAIVAGKVEFEEHIIELPIGRHPVKRKNMAVSFSPNTKYAKTKYRTLKRTDTYSLLELEPFTGRTHQLRVHLSYMGHPILGDKKYGKNDSFSRLALHARSIGFIHPRSKQFIEFSCDLPKEFAEFFDKPSVR